MFVDTSAFYALMDTDDRWHAEAVATLSRLRGFADLVTTNYVQVETLALVQRRLGVTAATQLIETLFPLTRVIWIDGGTHAAALGAYRASGSSISVVDLVSFAVMHAQGLSQAFAFDSDFERAGFARPTTTSTKAVHEDALAYGDSTEPELVSVAEISARAGRSISTVQSWRRRHGSFPQPIAQLAAGPIWDWPTVAAWVDERKGKAGTSPGGTG